jgi:FixJ family two-component response regulator
MSAESHIQPMVFVVNDDPSIRRWIEATLISAGLRVLTFETRAELMPHVRSGAIACAILDVSLPDGSGFELQSDLARAGIASMFLTRDRCIASCVRAVKAGAVDFLTMPCDSLSLVRALRDALRQSLSSRTQRAQSDELRSRYEQLTARERQVFALVSSGLRNKQVAHQLSISQITVQIHRGHVMKKMAARSFASLIRMADALLPDRTLPASEDALVNSGKAGKSRATARRRTALSCLHDLNSHS